MSTELLQKAASSFKAKDFSAAEKLLREILGSNPRDAHALHMMGAIGYEVKKYDFAEELLRMAIEEDSNVADFYVTLGLLQRETSKYVEALSAFKRAIELNPKHLRALIEAANLCRDIGARTRSESILEAALKYYTDALAIRADEDTYYSIAHLHHLSNRYAEAIATGESALRRHPQSARIMLGIASMLDLIQKYEEALKYCEKALEIDPKNAQGYAMMATTLKNLGRTEEAIAQLKKGLDYEPDKEWIYSNLLLTMVYASSVSPEELSEVCRQFGKRLADPHMRTKPHTNYKNNSRKLRVGYVSPDFREHAVSYFLAPVRHHDKRKFEIFAYSKAEKEDSVTAELKQYFDHWRDIKYLNHDSAADLIESDKIDILVDLAGHTASNSLLTFARKPAPVQVSWLGWPATTGIKAMDYRITDVYAEPPGMTEHLNTEKLWRLPDIFCAYSAHKNSPSVIDHPPFEDNGYITFGCFNNFTKVTDTVLQSWAKILDKVSHAKLLLEITGIENPKIRAETQARLEKQGLPIDRVILESRKKTNQFVLYNKIDIALDPFPCNGGTTSMDTLWMGVPFVTLAGRHFVSRMGVTILTNAGLTELIAEDIDSYVKIATELAMDQDRLKGMREGLREKFAASPVMDEVKFARNMEAAFREMWKEWVKRK